MAACFSFSLIAASTPFSKMPLIELRRFILASSMTAVNTGIFVVLYFAFPILNLKLSKSGQ